MDLVASIMAWESGELEEEQVIELFQELLDSGDIWHLQGCYQRMAISLIKQGKITPPAQNGVANT